MSHKEREVTTMKAMNKLEEKVLEMVNNGVKVKGWALDILIEIELREKEA